MLSKRGRLAGYDQMASIVRKVIAAAGTTIAGLGGAFRQASTTARIGSNTALIAGKGD